jgi:fatty acid desaturase
MPSTVEVSTSLITHSEYVRRIKPLLPKAVFSPSTHQLWIAGAHLLVIASSYLLLRHSHALIVCPTVAIVLGHSLGCLAFIAHDVSHNAVVRKKTVRHLLEMLLWGLNCFPPTLWHRIHNQTHHAETNTINDPDRAYRASEARISDRIYTRIFYPSNRSLKGNLFVFFHFAAYIIRNTVAALGPFQKVPGVTYRPLYSRRQKIFILVEIVIIAIFQIGIYKITGSHIIKYLWGGPASLLVASGVTMMYIFTNHFLNPLCEHTDPLIGSTSVQVPRWMDWIHDYFSFHTEHHLFPSMNPRYYPVVSRLLQTHFPDRYNRITLGEAWGRLWKQGEFIREGRKI